MLRDVLPVKLSVQGIKYHLSIISQMKHRCLGREFHVKNPFKGKESFDGISYLKETNSDHTSLQVIYEVWRELTNDTAAMLAGVPLESPEQLFFVTMAFPWCSALSKSLFRKHFKKRITHPINVLRINGGLSHTPEFWKGFNCTAENKLYRAKQCKIFD